MLASIQVAIAGQTNEEVVEFFVDDQLEHRVRNVGGDALDAEFANYRFEIENDSPQYLRIEFINDGFSPVDGEDRNVRVRSITVDGVEYDPRASNVLSTGTFRHPEGCAAGFKESQWLTCNGHFEIPLVGDAVTIPGTVGGALVDQAWQSQNLNGIADPVIITGVPIGEDQSPGVAQIRDVTPQGFDLRFKEWTYLDSVHGDEALHYLALTEGRYTTPDGSKWEVGTFDLNQSRNFRRFQFGHSFDVAPNLFLTVQTQNGAPVIVRAQNVFRNSFEAALFEEQALEATGHGLETIGYLAIQPGAESGVVTLGSTDIPYFFQTADIGTTAEEIASFGVKIQEERSFDAETDHAPETVNALALGRRIFAQVVDTEGLDPITLRQQELFQPQSLPEGFSIEAVSVEEDYRLPVAVEVDDWGRNYIADQRGLIYVVVDGVQRPSPFLDIRAEVDNSNFGAGQLTGFALDPNFTTNGHIYVLYTTTEGGESFGRLTRFTRGATNASNIDKSTARHLIGKTAADGLVAADFHSVGDIEFGEDGSLLFTWGDSASNDAEDPGHFNSQNFDIAAGNVFRINPATGRGYQTNPFFDGDLSSNQSKIWAYGLRNGYRLAVEPGTGSTDLTDGQPGRVLFADVGRDRFEELNVVDGGENFGWPYYEGTTRFRDGGENVEVTAPAAQFVHPQARSVIGGVFIEGDNYPNRLHGKYLLADFVRGWVTTFEVKDDGSVIESNFATGLKGIVDFKYDHVSGDILFAAFGRGTAFDTNEGFDPGIYRLKFTA